MNRQIRAPKVRVVGADGSQVGILPTREALELARKSDLDLVEVAPNASPPVCKVIDYGKFRYDQTKREKESKKAQHLVKVKEVKLKPNIDDHDYLTKMRRAHQFLEKGNKVKIACMFRGREMAYPENGRRVVSRMIEDLKDVGAVEAPMKMMGRNLFCVIAPAPSKARKEESIHAKNENK